MIYKSGNRNILTKNGLDKVEANKVVQQIESENYEVIKVLKDEPRSKVSRIRLNNLDLVLKIPREKNTKPWIRFLTFFRSSEVFKNLLGMKLLNSSGFKTTESYLACEYRNWGMVTDSWLLYHYLDGEECLNLSTAFNRVVNMLRNMHKKDILHGDAQIRNFLLSNEELYVIDANPSKSKSAFAKAYEFAYLKRSQPEIEQYFDENAKSRLYILASQFDYYERQFARKKRALKKALKLDSI